MTEKYDMPKVMDIPLWTELIRQLADSGVEHVTVDYGYTQYVKAISINTEAGDTFQIRALGNAPLIIEKQRLEG